MNENSANDGNINYVTGKSRETAEERKIKLNKLMEKIDSDSYQVKGTTANLIRVAGEQYQKKEGTKQQLERSADPLDDKVAELLGPGVKNRWRH